MKKIDFFHRKRGRKKKASRNLTFLIIPETAARPYRFNFSTRFLKTIAITAGLLVFISVSLCIAFYASRLEISGVNDLKKENLQNLETIDVLNEEIKQIEAQKEIINQKQNEIKKLMGIKEADGVEVESVAGGKGGEDSKLHVNKHADVLGLVQDIRTYLNRQEQELDELLAQVNNKTEYFRSIPNQWPTNGNITSPYGWRKSPFSGRSKSFHDGIDIANVVGTEVVAAADGKVVFSGYQAVYGRTAIIDHGYGFSSKYSHNSALLVEVGDEVKKGDVIAKMGSTGRSTGPHLHFTIIKSGNTQDPLIYLP